VKNLRSLLFFSRYSKLKESIIKSFLVVNYNIEFAHIYSDKKFGAEQKKSIEILKAVILKCLKKRLTFSCCVLIDDYNPKIKKLQLKSFLYELDRHNIYPHFIGFESKLVEKKFFLLNNIKNQKIKRNYLKYIKNKKHVPCSFLVAVWYLYRLGLLNLSSGIYKCYRHSNIFHGEKIINILHEKYRKSEEDAMEILRYSKFSDQIKNIETIFYK